MQTLLLPAAHVNSTGKTGLHIMYDSGLKETFEITLGSQIMKMPILRSIGIAMDNFLMLRPGLH